MKLTGNMEGKQRDLGLVTTAITRVFMAEIQDSQTCDMLGVPAQNCQVAREFYSVFYEVVAIRHGWTVMELTEEYKRRLSPRSANRHSHRLHRAYNDFKRLDPTQMLRVMRMVEMGPEVFMRLAIGMVVA